MKIKQVRNVSKWDSKLDLQEVVKYAYEDAACIDLVCCKTTHVPAFSNSKPPIPTGIAIELPAATFGLILPRSGLAKEHGISILGGVIDNDYRGEILVNLRNNSNKAVVFDVGDRVAQLAVLPYFRVSLQWVDELSETNRGESGHGSTGK